MDPQISLRDRSRLLSVQNADGGWGYQGGSSWTEPTAYALLALGRQPDASEAASRARKWLLGNQRPDGGFAPRPSVDESTWVTALAVLAGIGRDADERRAVEWLLARTNQDSTFVYRLRQWMLGNQALATNNSPGWPWYPGTAGWVVPTSLTILALGRVERRYPGGRVRERIEQGRRFLFERRCEDGGWNHGSSRSLGFQSVSYPETTGIALLALAGTDRSRLEKSVAKAEEHFRNCRSLEGSSWLQLGMLAQGRPAPEALPEMPARALMDSAISILADQARGGRNVFLGDAL
jgi:hypothetical protein